MKKIKRMMVIIIGVLSAGIIGIWGKIIYEVMTEADPVPMYGVESDFIMEKFNFIFTNYCGSDVKGILVKDLIKKINDINANDERKVEYDGPTLYETKSDRSYKVEVEFGDEGYVCKVIVTEN